MSATDYDAEVSAVITSAANKILQRKIIDFKIKNLKDAYDFTSEQLKLAQNNLYILQDSLAQFRDRNLSIKSDKFLNQLNRLETEVNISKNIYNELAITKEKTAIDLRKITPIFTTINSVHIPYDKFYPNRLLIIFVFLLIGILIIPGLIILESQFMILNKKRN